MGDGVLCYFGWPRAYEDEAERAVRAGLAAVGVEELVIPDAGHWLMEEQPAATVAAVRAFLDRKS
jgi:pimeloyl-ACP methyl ester carboxylesterase